MIESVGQKIHALRKGRGWSRAQLCERAGISVRFLAQVETGEANLSLLRLLELASALGVSVVSLVAGLGPVRDEAEILASLPDLQRARALRAARPPEKIALVGLRGAGKSTVGAMMAQALGVHFIEVDALIEGRAGMHLTEIFEFHGPSRYRELEIQVLAEVLERQGGAVLATGGSVVTSPEAWALLRQGARTVWLRATPEEYLGRVEAQGDFRPMRGRVDALAELKEILQHRESLYARSEKIIETSGKGVGDVVRELVEWLRS